MDYDTLFKIRAPTFNNKFDVQMIILVFYKTTKPFLKF